MEGRKHILFIALLVLLFLPLIEQKTGILPVQNLVGGDDPLPYGTLTTNSWTRGEFQSNFEQAFEERIGFRPVLIRIKNQLQYSLFKKANATGVIVGQDRFLFEEDYIRAYTGRDFLGGEFWNEKFRRLNLVRDTLQRLGIEIGLVLEPGKGTYYAEKIPEKYLKHRFDSTNYQSITSRATETSLPFLDLNSWFRNTKSNVEYPHFTRGGIHWANSAMLLAADTLLRFADLLTTRDVPELFIEPGRVTTIPEDTDNDLVEIMNLLVRPKTGEMHYPGIRFEQVPDSLKPRVLIISDSFYFNILNAGIPAQAFANNVFWYYSKAVYPDTWTAPRDTSMLDIQQEVESQDLILLMITERFYYKLAWNFIETLYKIYYPEMRKNFIYDYKARIITDYQWFNLVVEDALNRHLFTSSALEDHAKYQLWKDEQDGLIKKDVSFYIMKILKDPAWTEKIREKAELSGISFDQQLELDAQWMVEHD